MPNFFQPVLANLEAIIQAIVLVVILASGAVRMFRESKEAQKRAERQRQRQQPRPMPDPAGRAGPNVAQAHGGEAPRPAPQEAIRSEVEEFLRRVGQDADAGRPQQQAKRAPQTKRRPSIEVLDEGSGFGVDDRPRQSRRRPRPNRPKPQPEQVQPTEQLQRVEGIERGDTVASHVAEHLKRGEFEERAAHMGEELSQTDERLEARLHQKFDHGLGSLSARRLAREAEDLAQRDLRDSPGLADDLLEQLATSQGVQQAVILSEVLKRPTDRW